MPDRTHAETLTAAADKLDALLAKLGDRWVVDVAVLTDAFRWLGRWLGPSHDALTATWPQAAYVAAMNPAVGRALVVLLRAEAVRAAVDAARVPPRRTDRELLDLARTILGSAEAFEECCGRPDICPECKVCLSCSIDGHDEGCVRGATLGSAVADGDPGFEAWLRAVSDGMAQDLAAASDTEAALQDLHRRVEVHEARRLVFQFWDHANLCHCGNSHVLLRQLHDALEAHTKRWITRQDWINANLWAAYTLDAWNLTDHGSSVYGAWLTPDGIRLRNALRVVDPNTALDDDWYDTEQAIYPDGRPGQSPDAPLYGTWNPHDAAPGTTAKRTTSCAASTDPRPGRLQRIAEAHTKHVDHHGGTSGLCNECGWIWPCATYQWATGDMNPTTDPWDPHDAAPEATA